MKPLPLSLLVASIVVASSLSVTKTVGTVAQTEVDSCAARVLEIPKQFGDWNMVREVEPKPRVLEILQCSAFIQRDYAHVTSGEQVSAVWVVGPSGPTSVHIPEICFSSQNHKLKSKTTEQLANNGGDLWKTMFQSNTVDASSFPVYYGWSRGDEWVASVNPRYEFGGVAMLYKMQVSATVDGDIGVDFINDFVSGYWAVGNSR